MSFEKRTGFLAVAALVAMSLLAGCTTNPATGEQSFTGLMSREKEKEIGAEQHPQLLKQFGGAYSDAELQAYVEQLGQKLAAHSETPGQEFRFFVLNDETVNAFALPGGYVYVSRGLIALCENEAELAGVIGHEIGHVVARHSAQRYSSAVATQIGVTAVGILGSIFGAPSGIGNAVAYGAQAALQTYSRSQELEADRLGIRYMSRAGYDTGTLGDFFAKLDAQTTVSAAMSGKSEAQHTVMSTHPRTEDRIAQARSLASETMPANPVRAREALLTQIDGIVFGKDPNEGFMKGDTFVHPALGFSFEFPPNFKVDNGASRVLGTNQKGTEIVFSMASQEDARATRDLAGYLANQWAKEAGVTPENIERLKINGLDAATGSAFNLKTNFGTRDVRLLAIRAGRDSIYRFIFLTAPGVTDDMSVPLRRTTYSFRLLDPGEGKGFKPPHIEVVDVGSGDTASSLAQRMPFGKFNDDWFRVLNLVAMSGGLERGEKAKLVRD